MIYRPLLMVAIEGFDGSGKSTLARALRKQLVLHGEVAKVVGKRGVNSSPFVSAVTRSILKIEGGQMSVTEHANLHLRLARLVERRALALEGDVATEVVLFDRWILSELAQLTDQMAAISAIEMEGSLVPDLTFFLSCPIDVAWERVIDRRRALTPRQRLGRESNIDLYEGLDRLAASPPSVAGRVRTLDATRSADSVLREASAILFELRNRAHA